MEYVSEVSKIIEHALAGNRDAVKSYSQLLADKLRRDGDDQCRSCTRDIIVEVAMQGVVASRGIDVSRGR